MSFFVNVFTFLLCVCVYKVETWLMSFEREPENEQLEVLFKYSISTGVSQ